jgi:hypothetical protein
MRKYEIHLPLNYSDGQSVEPERIRRVHLEVLSVFGSFTVPYQKSWEYHPNSTTEIVKIEAITSSKITKKRLKNLKERLKESLRRSDILIMIRSIQRF